MSGGGQAGAEARTAFPQFNTASRKEVWTKPQWDDLGVLIGSPTAAVGHATQLR